MSEKIELTNTVFIPEHGGALHEASEFYRIPTSDWLDLSTGINPNGYPINSEIIKECILAAKRLPELTSGLAKAVQHYYGNHAWVIGNGSQGIIQSLPSVMQQNQWLSKQSKIGLLRSSYSEHKSTWQRHAYTPLEFDSISELIDRSDDFDLEMAVIVHPNNPTSEQVSLNTLESFIRLSQKRQRWLVIDEAYIDATPDESVLALSDLSYCVVLRSLGKFFGVPGWRVGFAFGDPEVIESLETCLGPWSVSSPALKVAEECLLDEEWQIRTLDELLEKEKRMRELLQPMLQDLTLEVDSIPLFVTIMFPEESKALWFYQFAAARGVLLRYFPKDSLVRLGFPGDEQGWLRLALVLEAFLKEVE